MISYLHFHSLFQYFIYKEILSIENIKKILNYILNVYWKQI